MGPAVLATDLFTLDMAEDLMSLADTVLRVYYQVPQIEATLFFGNHHVNVLKKTFVATTHFVLFLDSF